MAELTVERLLDVMRICAGEPEGVVLSAELADVEFADIGYDSVAVLETTVQIEREYGVALSDEQLTGARTPAAFVEVVRRATSPVRDTA